MPQERLGEPREGGWGWKLKLRWRRSVRRIETAKNETHRDEQSRKERDCRYIGHAGINKVDKRCAASYAC
jgi:hypothetical protein